MKVFNDYSNYYDLLYDDKDYNKEVDYIHHLIQKEFPGAKSILNLGCGTGKHDMLLAELGYEITAVDFSETMIEIAKQNNTMPNKISFSVGDIRTLDLGKKFDAVISLFHVISYQVNDSDLNSAFDTAKKHLKPNGIFLFDYWYGPGVLADPPHERDKQVENEQLKIKRHTTPIWIKEKNTVEVVFDIEIQNKRENATYKISETHPMRYLFEADIRNAAKSSGMNRRHSFKWMTVEKPSSNDWYVIDILK